MRDIERPPVHADARRRTFAEQAIVDHLMLHGFAREIRQGDGAAAERECRAALDRWVEGGLPFARGDDGARLFDPFEVVNTMKWAGLHHGDPFFADRFVATARALIGELHAPGVHGDVPPPAALAPRAIDVTLSREFDTSRVEPGTRTLLRLPLPVEDASLADLRVSLDAAPGLDAEVRIAPGRLDARLVAPATGRVTLTVRVAATLRAAGPEPSPAPLTASERSLYTQPSEGLVRVTPRVQALASTLAGTVRDDRGRVRAFWNFVLDELVCGMTAYEDVDGAQPLEHVLDSGWFDCQMGSALLVALCRAQGIPARVAGGYLVYPSSAAVHWWAEVWLPDGGWVALDTLCADLSLHGRDAKWRDYFFGALDYRLKCEVLPRIFSRTPGLHLPVEWRMLVRADGTATQIGLFACTAAAPIYRDRLDAKFAPVTPGVS